MSNPSTTAGSIGTSRAMQEGALLSILVALSFSHLLNDMVQSLLPSIYPILKTSYHLDFSQIGLITLTYQATASLLQPVVGYSSDRYTRPYLLPAGMACTLCGLLFLAEAHSFHTILMAASCVGIGSAVFHPEGSCVARVASGGRHGFAQSLFQVGGNTGSAIGPLLAAFLVLPRGQGSVAWFSVAALLAIALLMVVSNWYKVNRPRKGDTAPVQPTVAGYGVLPTKTVVISISILLALIFSKFIYLASLTSYYTFYLINTFHVSVRSSQVHLFIFLGAVAAGTFAGGPIGDWIGRKYVIWCSILGVLPFTLMLPYANLFWTTILSVVIGLVLSSAFAAIVVYAHELVPGRIGFISGLFFGFSFGMGGVGAALIGKLADMTSISVVYHVCSYLPVIGLLTGFLPNLERQKPTRTQAIGDLAEA